MFSVRKKRKDQKPKPKNGILKREKINMKKNQIKLTERIQLKREIVNWKTILRKWLRMNNRDIQRYQIPKWLREMKYRIRTIELKN